MDDHVFVEVSWEDGVRFRNCLLPRNYPGSTLGSMEHRKVERKGIPGYLHPDISEKNTDGNKTRRSSTRLSGS